jgi:hypothetical protein
MNCDFYITFCTITQRTPNVASEDVVERALAQWRFESRFVSLSKKQIQGLLQVDSEFFVESESKIPDDIYAACTPIDKELTTFELTKLTAVIQVAMNVFRHKYLYDLAFPDDISVEDNTCVSISWNWTTSDEFNTTVYVNKETVSIHEKKKEDVEFDISNADEVSEFAKKLAKILYKLNHDLE